MTPSTSPGATRPDQCPGGAEYGHGMSLTTVHAGGCCEAWAAKTRAGKVQRYPGTIHLIPGCTVAPVCTGDDCPVCDAKDEWNAVNGPDSTGPAQQAGSGLSGGPNEPGLRTKRNRES